MHSQYCCRDFYKITKEFKQFVELAAGVDFKIYDAANFFEKKSHNLLQQLEEVFVWT